MGIFALLAPVLSTVIDKLIPDRDAAAKAKAEIEAQLISADVAARSQQVELNKIEAASPSLFVSGWRPFIGWGCGIALLYQFLLYDWLSWGLAIAHVAERLPTPNSDILLELVLAMLGFGGFRTFEKLKGVASR